MTTKTDTEQEREAFEAWLLTLGLHLGGHERQLMLLAYQAGRAALQSQPNIEATEWLKQHEALMHRVSKAALVVGYGGTINGSAAEQTLENAEKALLDHARALQSQDREDAERLDWLEEQAQSSRTGASIDYVYDAEDGHVNEKGYRFWRHRFMGPLGKTAREAIDHARRIEGDGE